MTSLVPRVVLVSRQTEFDGLLAAHGTRGQAAFFLRAREQCLEPLEERHIRQLSAIDSAKRAIPREWSLAQVERQDLDRFLFMPNDIVVAIGQDGLVANLAKYVDEQIIIGVTPEPDRTEGILTSLSVDVLPDLLLDIGRGRATITRRAMVEARLGEAQSLRALNELFVGHRSHQSARYIVRYGGAEEYQSSSGVIVATGTGLTGWAKSILTATRRSAEFDREEQKALFLAREPWPSNASGCSLTAGQIDAQTPLSLFSRMDEGGVIFADGIEKDFLRFDWGLEATITISDRALHLAV